MNGKHMTMSELAEYLGVSQRFVEVRVQSGEWPFTQHPGSRLVRFSPVDVELIESIARKPALNGPLARKAVAA